MQLWNGYGSEHSMNLVMIGHFTAVEDARKAKAVIDALTVRAQEEGDDAMEARRFSDATLDVFRQLNFWSLAPQELAQFAMDATVKHDGAQIILTTEEVDVSAFLKVLVDKGARVEVYSAHVHPDLGHGRRTSSD